MEMAAARRASEAQARAEAASVLLQSSADKDGEKETLRQRAWDDWKDEHPQWCWKLQAAARLPELAFGVTCPDMEGRPHVRVAYMTVELKVWLGLVSWPHMSIVSSAAEFDSFRPCTCPFEITSLTAML